jgi:CubicO group peptidase (beta-lactamase class C family)
MTELAKKVDKMFMRYVGEVPGAAFVILKNNKILLERCYGLADLERSIPVGSSTNFRLASVSKAFTAMCILKLVESGKLSLEDTLYDVIPDFPKYGRTITLRYMLNHTSGIQDYKGGEVQLSDNDVLEQAKGWTQTNFTPGTKYEYSNCAYVLLGKIVEFTSGISFPRFMKNEIFTPLKMNDSILYMRGGPEIRNRAYGYLMDNGVYTLHDQSSTSALLGDGGVYTNLEDMFKWDDSLYTEKIVSYDTLREAFTQGPIKREDGVGYGYGWYITSIENRKLIYHTGDTVGFRTFYFRCPEEGLSIIILTNRDSIDCFKEPILNVDGEKDRMSALINYFNLFSPITQT